MYASHPSEVRYESEANPSGKRSKIQDSSECLIYEIPSNICESREHLYREESPLNSEEMVEAREIEIRRLWNGRQLEMEGPTRIPSDMYELMMERLVPKFQREDVEAYIQSLRTSAPESGLAAPQELLMCGDELLQLPIELLNQQIFESIFTEETLQHFSEPEKNNLLKLLPDGVGLAQLSSIIPSLDRVRQQWALGKFHPDLSKLYSLLQEVERETSLARADLFQAHTLALIRERFA